MVPGRGRRWGCQERAGPPQEQSWEAWQEPGRSQAGQPGGIQGGGAPLGAGTGKNEKAGGPVTDPALRPRGPGPPSPPLTWARSWTSSGPPPRWRTGSSAPGRGCGLAPGRREARSRRPPRRPWRWRWTRTRRRRPPPRWTRTTRWPGPAWGASAAEAAAAAAAAAVAGTGRPQSPAGRCRPRRLQDHHPPLRVQPWPGRGWGTRGLRGSGRRREDAQASPTAAARDRLVSSARPPERASERARGCTHARGLSARGPRARPPLPVAARAAETLGGRVRGGRGALAGAGPTQHRGAGPGLALASLASLWARSPRSPCSLAPRAFLVPEPGRTLLLNPRRGRQPAGPVLPSPAVLSAATARPAETPLFRGAAPARRGLPRERASGPSDPQSPAKPASRQPT